MRWLGGDRQSGLPRTVHNNGQRRLPLVANGQLSARGGGAMRITRLLAPNPSLWCLCAVVAGLALGALPALAQSPPAPAGVPNATAPALPAAHEPPVAAGAEAGRAP